MKNSLAIVLALLALITCKIAFAETPTAPTKEASAIANARPVKRAPASPKTTSVKHLVCKSQVTRALEQQGAGPRTMVTVCEM